MGVQGLWDLVAPVGRRVSVETLAGKRLAIDASIWIIQFMKAMRDEKGEMVRHAHILGFFRRICKLLFLRTKPVFVFDGGTPTLKRRTVIARRRQRENAQAKIRKTAEKLLLNQLKAMRVKELNAQKSKPDNQDKGKKAMVEQDEVLEKNDFPSGSLNQEMIDEMLAASLAAEEGGGFINPTTTQADIGTSFDASASKYAAATPLADEEEDDDEEMILPMMNGNVDPSVLADLPPSMQLDLLVQMRERLMAENRQKYQKVKKAPQKFSELQIEAYLKTVAFRREIDGAQRAAAGKGVGGIQTSRIASEANREFIFSSSFSGDKKAFAPGELGNNSEREGIAEDGSDCRGNVTSALATGGPGKNSDREEKAEDEPDCQGNVTSATLSDRGVTSTARPSPGISSAPSTFGADVQTYLDDRGRTRLSRVRALGVRMTRDLQRNLDLMKELEQDRVITGPSKPNVSGNDVEAHASRNSSSQNQSMDKLDDSNVDPQPSNISNSVSQVDFSDSISLGKSEKTIEISFEDDGARSSFDGYDELFSQLVVETPMIVNSDAKNLSENCVVESASDCEWEDGIIGAGDTPKDASDTTGKQGEVVENNHDELEVEWESGDIEKDDYAPSPLTTGKTVSKGSLEETAALDEAIRRSLLDVKTRLSSDNKSGELASPMEDDAPAFKVPNLPSHLPINEVTLEKSVGSPMIHSTSPPAAGNNDADTLLSDQHMPIHSVDDEHPSESTVQIEKPRKEKAEGKQVEAVKLYEDPCKSLIDDSNVTSFPAVASEAMRIDISDVVSADLLADTSANIGRSDLKDRLSFDFNEGSGVPVGSVAEKPPVLEQMGVEEVPDTVHKKDRGIESATIRCADGGDGGNFEVLGAGLEEELLILDQEYEKLGNQQRKLERNADSVNSEMFVECQELLQMFGIPYVVAPMEAEAQCAYMELTHLVDGVVTDDSDVFLFGAKNVYKNIFDDRKYVETYFMKDIEDELGLDRGKLIRMALLLGSDYTEGISGIGIVNAIEVVNAFPDKNGLHKFREWVESPDPSIFVSLGSQPGSQSKQRGSKTSDGVLEGENDTSEGDKDDKHNESIDSTKQMFMDKHRNVSKNWHIPSSFPSDAVISAYESPQVDKSTEPFSWGKPDHFALRK